MIESLRSNPFSRKSFIEKQLVNLLRKYDEKIEHHFETCTVFSGLSSHIQNELIKAVGNVLLNEIKAKIKDATFAAILVDELTEASNFAQLSTVWRKVTKEGVAEERFVGF